MHGHRARKRFGQNFLADPHYVRRIVDAVDPKPGDNIVEIGPGLAALTAQLVERAGRIKAIEIDRDLAARLRDQFAESALELHEADALAFDFATLGDDLRVVGNLPYNVSSPLLFRFVERVDQLRDIHVMLQKEVVARMAAEPDTPEYGRLTVMLGAAFRIERLLLVPAGAFRPVPKVESAVARLTPLGANKPDIADPALFARVVAAAFAQRRKTLRNALSSLCSAEEIARASIDPSLRGEALAVADFVRLANSLASTT